MPVAEDEQFREALQLIDITEKMVWDELKNLSPGKSAGPDGIHPRVLSEAREEILHPLLLIFRKSVETGVVPSAWKDAEVVPIFKKGQKSSPGNYRPVSLTSVCSKILERIVRSHIMAHVNANQLFTPAQHGFRPSRSCTTQLLTVTEDWTRWEEDGLPYDCIYLDYRKAFDSVPHERLLSKLYALGIRGKLHCWIRSFLSGRRQRVRVENSLSSWRPVTSGIPQGSVLGPTLFLCFINDLPKVVKGRVALFADDTKLYGTSEKEDEISSLQKDVDELYKWSTQWQLPFNEEKCKVIYYGRHNKRNVYHMNNKPIATAEEEKDLGVLFDESMDYARHINSVTKKANSRVGLVRRCFRSLDEKPFKTLYKSLIRPVVEYASSVAHPVHTKEEDKLEGVQRRASKLPSRLKDLSYSERLHELKLPTLRYRRKRADVLQTWRILHNEDDIEEEKFFHRNDDTRTRGHSLRLRKTHSST
jgi:molybdopterin converting factor small subunit